MAESSASERSHKREVSVGVLIVGMAVAVWWPSFTLGAWGDLFFDQLLTIWAASTAAFVFVIIERRPVGVRLLRALLLLLPSVWLGLSFAFTTQDENDLGAMAIDLLAIIVVLIGAPFTLFVLARIIWPEFGDQTRARTKWFVAAVVVGIAVASFALGANNAMFMTCEDFTLSGNSEPPGCVHEDPS